MAKKKFSKKKRTVIRKVKRKIVRKTKPKVRKIKRIRLQVKSTKVKLEKTVRENRPKLVGEIVHFYDKISVAVVKFYEKVKVGDRIKIEGHGKSFTQKIDSMQVEHESISEVGKNQDVGLKVNESVKEKDLIYKV